MRHLLARAGSRARGVAVAAGLTSYRPPGAQDLAGWSDQYEKGGWDYLAGVHQLPRYSVLAGYLDYFDCRSILDVGCGAGLLRERISGIDFHRYLGIDPVPSAIERAGHLADERTMFMVGNVFLPDLGEFDAVVCNEVLYCVRDPAALIDRAMELVSPDRYFLTSDLRHPGDAGLRRMLAKRMQLVAAVDLSNDTERGRRRRRVAAYRRARR
jgi:2-polyprenyl-3-methyl-5-hydroxy-6-metoxy-1,4-benzoquinol methylase